MIRPFTGIQTGPRQFELPPNMPLSDSAGRYETRYSSAPSMEDERMVGVISRQRAYAVRAQELALVQHARQHAPQPRLIEDRRHQSALAPGLRRIVDGPYQLRVSLDEAAYRRHRFRMFLAQLALEDRHGAQRQQADHRAHLEALRGAVRQSAGRRRRSRPPRPTCPRCLRLPRRSWRKRSTGSARRTSGTSSRTSVCAS